TPPAGCPGAPASCPCQAKRFWNFCNTPSLRGEPPPEWTRRANAKDDVRERARELREQGLDYEEIAAALGVSKSSVSLWVRDLPRPVGLSWEECRKRSAEGARRYWAAERQVRAAARTADVRRSSSLYRRIEAWSAAIMKDS
ncbi:MAG: helix-turn-helix domain-containing protein, partial [Streptosporangiaceae bacterium]